MMQTSWLNQELNAEVLHQNRNWSIEKLNETEIVITDGWTTTYCYLNPQGTRLVSDRTIHPRYIEKKALDLAKKHITSTYK